MQKENTQDRRLSLRIPLRVSKVNTLENEREIFFGYAKDISSNGMQIQTSNPKEIGATFNISFELPSNKNRFSCEVEVVWAQEYDPKMKLMPGMGIKFINLESNAKKEIDDYVNKNS